MFVALSLGISFHSDLRNNKWGFSLFESYTYTAKYCASCFVMAGLNVAVIKQKMFIALFIVILVSWNKVSFRVPSS